MGVRDGCYNCNKRRIICDKTEPYCVKCTKKGLQCPGITIRYRFNDGIASRGKLRGVSFPLTPSSDPKVKTFRAINQAKTTTGSECQQSGYISRLYLVQERRRPADSQCLAGGNTHNNLTLNTHQTCLQPISGKSRHLLNYCRSHFKPGSF